MFKQNTKFEILTPTGFQPFSGIKQSSHPISLQINTDSGIVLQCTTNHQVLTTEGFILCKDLTVGMTIVESDKESVIVDLKLIDKIDNFYDAVEVDGGHQYITNNIVSHNCDFLSSEALLVNSLKLAEVTQRLSRIQPMYVIDEVVFWYDIKPGGTYLVGVDPATGTGKDFTVITVYHFPSMRQVAEFRSNTMSPNDSYKVLKNILIFLENKGTMVYFSVENNGVGEGIISLFEADENSPTNSEFVSEEGKGKRGFFTTARSKMKACVNFKEMFEKDNIHITSPILLQELKTFVRTKGAYDHLPGSTSDCIAATLTVIRLIEEIATYDQNAFDKLYSTTGFTQWENENIEYNENSDEDAPMPFI
jgi:hypothetical protein